LTNIRQKKQSIIKVLHVCHRSENSDTKEIKSRLEVLGFKVKSLMQPTVQAGHLIKLKATGIDDVLKVESISHVGDTMGGEWYSEMSLRFTN